MSLTENIDVKDGKIASDALNQRLEMLVRDLRVYGEVLARQRFDLEFLQLVKQRSIADLQPLCGLRAIPAIGLQDAQNDLALEALRGRAGNLFQ